MRKAIIIICMLSVIALSGCNNDSPFDTGMEVCVSECEPCVASDIIIFDFESQDIYAQCRGENPQDDWLPVWFNSSLKIVKRYPLDIEQIGFKKIIYPTFYTYFEDRHPDLWLDDIECRIEGNFEYNVTINGETISDFHYVDYNDCQQYYNCGIEKMILEKYT